MSILPNPETTQEDITKRRMAELNDLVENTIFNAKDRTAVMMRSFWEPEGTTPMLLAEAYGKSAYLLFEKLYIWQQAIMAVDPSYVPVQVPSKYEYTMNADGSVTIIEKPPVVEPTPEPTPEPIPDLEPEPEPIPEPTPELEPTPEE